MRLRQCWVLAICCASAAMPCAWAQTAPATPPAAPPVTEVLAKDLGEAVVRIPVTVKDMYGRQETKNMPITIYRPTGEGPFPLLVFNHGRAVAAKRAAQGRNRPETAARYFVAKGFVVLAPTRIGYGETYGDFDPEQSGGCNNLQVEAMSLAASDQVLAAVEYAKTLPFVVASRWLVAGQSVGGLTSIATVARVPAGLTGGINFAGGTGGNPDASPGRPCRPQALENYWGRIAGQAQVPMLWLYWENDKYWGPDVPKAWHQAWVAGGGMAELASFAPSGEDGHNGLFADMDHWLPVVDDFLNRLGFNRPGIVPRPQASGFADVQDTSRVPVTVQSLAAYQKFLESPLPRAFAVSGRGGWGYSVGDYAHGRALGNCQRQNFGCRLYAIDNDVVWTGK
jgi:dienelactone hydrolase